MSVFIGNKVLNVAETLSGRKWSDSEIGEDLEFIKEELSRSVANLRLVLSVMFCHFGFGRVWLNGGVVIDLQHI